MGKMRLLRFDDAIFSKGKFIRVSNFVFRNQHGIASAQSKGAIISVLKRLVQPSVNLRSGECLGLNSQSNNLWSSQKGMHEPGPRLLRDRLEVA